MEQEETMKVKIASDSSCGYMGGDTREGMRGETREGNSGDIVGGPRECKVADMSGDTREGKVADMGGDTREGNGGDIVGGPRECKVADMDGDTREGKGEDKGAVRTELFSMEIQTCIIVGEDTEIRVVKLSNVLSFYCVCKECGKRFAAKSKLKAHMNVHLKSQENVSTVSNTSTSDLPREKIEAKSPVLTGTTSIESDDVGEGESDNSMSEKLNTPKNPDLKFPGVACEDVQKQDQFLNESETRTRSNRTELLSRHCEPNDISREAIDKMIEKQRRSGKSGSLKCTICGIEVAGGRQTFIKHMNRHTGEKPYICSVCGRGYSAKSQLAAHVRVHTGDPYTCQECGKQFKKSKALNVHRTTHQGKAFPCTVCDKRFCNRSKVKEHMRTHTGVKPYECRFCGKAFSKSGTLKCHIMVHTGVKPHLCTTCGKSFSTTSNLKTHIKMHTGERPYLCTICGKGFSQLSTLNMHVSTHDTSFSCSLCDRSFKYESSLKQHVKINHEDNSLTCDICGKIFQHYVYLKSHLRTHEKPYTCSECGKSFSSKYPYDNHMRIHTGEKPYRCSHCVQTFRLRTSLVEHINEQHPETKQPSQPGTNSVPFEDNPSSSDTNWNVGRLIDELTNVTSALGHLK